MKINEISRIAKERGVKSFGKGKEDIIREIQRAEGNFECFARAASGFCDQTGCLWRADCLPPGAFSLQPPALVERVPPGGKGIRGQGLGVGDLGIGKGHKIGQGPEGTTPSAKRDSAAGRQGGSRNGKGCGGSRTANADRAVAQKAKPAKPDRKGKRR